MTAGRTAATRVTRGWVLPTRPHPETEEPSQMSAPLPQRVRATAEQGFTLIELLVVIVILGVLSGIVVFAVGGVGDKGQASACKIDKRTLQTAQEAYFAQPTSRGGGGGKYATNQDTLVSAGFLSEKSTLHDTGSSGAVSPVAGGPCASS